VVHAFGLILDPIQVFRATLFGDTKEWRPLTISKEMRVGFM
jgi:hypothetical protein